MKSDGGIEFFISEMMKIFFMGSDEELNSQKMEL
jgi:hypothetical protein